MTAVGKLDEIQARAEAAQEGIAGGLNVPLISLVATLKASHADVVPMVAALRAVEEVVVHWGQSYEQAQGILARAELDVATHNEIAGGAESTRVGIIHIRTAIREALG